MAAPPELTDDLVGRRIPLVFASISLVTKVISLIGNIVNLFKVLTGVQSRVPDHDAPHCMKRRQAG
ncbi:hypothetical protein ACP70R_015190 [Stipagrostis hirtigluma subsp. patula]